MRARWHLDEPIYVQYTYFFQNLTQGELGTSFRLGTPVVELVVPKIINSFILVAPAIITGYIVGSIFGTYMGINKNKPQDRYMSLGLISIGTIPEFVLGIVLVAVGAQLLGIFPTSGMVSPTFMATNPNASIIDMAMTKDFWMHYTLPFLTIALRYLFSPSLIMRTSVIEVAGQGFTYYNRMKGLPSLTRFKHLFRHASLPVLTGFPASMTRALGGVVIVEIIFNWPGIGSLLVDSVLFQDYPVVQAVFIFIAIWVILGNYIVDILYTIIDPRITLAESN
jgi:peptide/nickel transport system permease protein